MTIVKTLTDIVGGDYAFAAEDDRAAPYHELFADLQAVRAGFVAVVLPADAEQLQAVVRAVHRAGYALWATPNAAGNGAVISRDERDAVIVDQRRMNRILEVDDFAATALVEPGVSYRQLYEYLQENNINLWIDSDRDADHSIAGSICSRHVGYSPYGNHTLMQCGMEVVLADGDMLRTGMGALPGSDTWQLSKYNFGPYLDGLFSQSDLALVTKVGLWLMPPPPVYKPFMVTLPDAGAMAAMVEALRDLKLTGTLPNTVAVSNMSFETSLHYTREEFRQAGPINPNTIKTVSGLGVWNVFAALYGGPDNVDLTWETVSRVLRGIDGAVIFTEGDRGDDPVWRKRVELMRGGPASGNVDPGRQGRSLRLTAAAPIEGEAARRMHDIARRVTKTHALDYLCEYVMPSRVLLKQIYLPYAVDDAADLQNAVAAAVALMEELTGAGYGIVDESLQLRRLVDNHYSGSKLNDLVGRMRAAVGLG